ncbi:Glyco_trans_2-like domain-containing protein [Azospirillaceae bacterium]
MSNIAFMSPRVSVLMTIYNAGVFLKPALDGLMLQDMPDFELVAIENGSDDGSYELLRQYASDKRVRIIRLEKNIGRTPALNLALQESRADLIAILDADDISLPSRLRLQADFFEKNPKTVLLGSWCRFLYKDNMLSATFAPPISHQSLLDMMSEQNPFVHSSVMYPRRAALAVGGYPVDFPYAQDFALFLRMVKNLNKIGGELAMIPEILTYSRVHGDSLTSSQNGRLEVARDSLRLFQEARTLPGLSQNARRNGRKTAVRTMIHYATVLRQNGYLRKSLFWRLRAFGSAPIFAMSDPNFCRLW